MYVWTWGLMKAKIEKDLDLQDEDFIQDTELLDYANSAVKEAHKEYIKTNEPYLETESALALVSGTSAYTLPTDIYASKIVLMQYNDGSTKYVVRELKDKKKIPYIQTNDAYVYRIINTPGVGAQLKIYPTAQETSASNVTIHYIRDATLVASDASLIDLPEAADFIMQHIKDACRNKEAGPMVALPPSEALERQRMLLIEILSDMTPDGDNLLQGDYSFYDEFDSNLGEF